ncbi:TRAP transporter large permease [Mesorhizobium sp. Z1-4]|uniref:TRAP transporter large permease n=1 Tax=Mesorhizobium sp. Z1-4 TaxID=2448478 RepID=UPI000FD95B1D|nr:TRAP transporter large permease [Mesorhizobium sp. Z1-4]
MTFMLFALFVGLVVLGVPITMAIGASVILALIYAGFGSELHIMPQQILEGVDRPALLAVPFFVLAGNLMNAVGMTDRIFRFATALVGHTKAGLAQVNVVASMVFAGISGASVADTAGLGTVEMKAMRERGYPADFAAALSVVSSVIGPLIPPSIPLIIYAFLSSTSVARLFLAGIVPGILVGVSLMIYNRMVADRYNFPREEKAPARVVLREAIDGLAALVAPAIILGAMLWGFTTASEAGVLACVYSLLLGAVYRTLDARKLWEAVTETAIITGIIMIIVGYSQVMGWLLAIEQAPQYLANSIVFVSDNKHIFMILMIAVVLLLGMIVEGVPITLILVPMLLPIVDQMGIDRIQFGVVFTLALLMGVATPPMGIGLYIMVGISKEPMERIAAAALPMLIPLLVVLLLIAYIPALTLFLPNLVMGLE